MKKYTVYKLKKHPTTKIKRTLAYTEKDGDFTMATTTTSLRKQPTFGNATTGFPAKWRN